MVPALRPGEILYVRRPAARQAPRRSDIAFLRFQRTPRGRFVKRIVGCPGEHVSVRGARVFVNGEALPEPYLDERSALEPKPDAEWRLGKDQFIVLGDARDDSLDSRSFGPVAPHEIQGIVRFRLWPLRRLGPLGFSANERSA